MEIPQWSRHFCYQINPLVWIPIDLPRSASRDLERTRHIKEFFPKLRDYKVSNSYLLNEVSSRSCRVSSQLLQLCDPVDKQNQSESNNLLLM